MKNNPPPRRPAGVLKFNLLAVLIGLVAGIGAVVFRGLIGLVHNVFFLGEFSFAYDANAHTPPSPWGPLVILVPVVGAIGVTFLVKNFAPEAKGHGVPEVMDAIYYNRGVIRPVVAAIKALASALSIGTGGSIGREGPIIQIGASFGSTVGQVLPLPPWQRITLIAAGAGGGIAATFNTPIGGVLFAVEIMMHEVSARTLIPVALSTATATYIGRLIFGPHPSFVIPALETPSFRLIDFWMLLSFVGLGILMGIASAVFIKSIYAFEDFFERRFKDRVYAAHMIGMLLVGVMMYVLLITLGRYYIEGVGYATIRDLLTGSLKVVPVLLLLYALKLLATSLTLGSGASGGIFSPSLYMGATLGAAYGLALSWAFPVVQNGLSGFPVAGMAGLVGGATGAAMAAIAMIFEMTLDYNVIIPITVTVAVSYGVRRILCRESIYTLKLARRGHYLPQALQANFGFARRAVDVMQSAVALPPSTPLTAFGETVLKHPEHTHFLVADGDRIVAVVGRDAALEAVEPHGASKTLGQVAGTPFAVVSPDDTVGDVLTAMLAQDVDLCLVASTVDSPSVKDVRGIIADHDTAVAAIRSADLF